MTRVLIVDDSTFVREHLRALISSAPGFVVVGEARHGREALDVVLATHPDVVIMDVDMPVMDGIEATRAIMEQHPTPILIHTSSSISRQHNLPFEAIRIGALDIIDKPAMYPMGDRERRDFLARLSMLAGIHVYRRVHASSHERAASNELASSHERAASNELASPQQSGPLREHGPVRDYVELGGSGLCDAAPGMGPAASRVRNAASGTGMFAEELPPARQITASAPAAEEVSSPRVLAIAASTGGPRVLAELFQVLPPVLSFPILLVQHIGPLFVQSFAAWMQSLTSVQIRVAVDGEPLLPNTCYISPGHLHLALRMPFNIHLDDGPPEHSCKPAADVLFRSVRATVGRHAVGAVLTGLGQDGAEGLRAMRESGALTIAQNEQSSVVFGMPRRALELNAAAYVGGIDDIAHAVQRAFGIG